MRIPKSHVLTLAYIRRFGLSISPFTASNPQAYYYLHGQKRRIAEVECDPDLLCDTLAEHERGKTFVHWWETALAPIATRLRESDYHWEEIVAEYDNYSTREFLERNGWSEGAIEIFGLLSNQEALMNASFLELLREELGCYYREMVEIEGGMDSLPRAFLPELGRHIRYGAHVTALDQDENSVTVAYRTVAGSAALVADYALVTLPFPVLRHIETPKPFSRGKQRAIRQLYYDASAKILMQCRRRFWEDEGIVGGGTITDLPIRNLYYPDHGRETGRGVLLASYTWSEDAQRWGSLFARGAHPAGARRRGRDPSADQRRVRSRSVESVAPRPVRGRCIRAFHSRPTDPSAERHRRTRGPHPFRGRAHLAHSCLDSGGDRVGPTCRRRNPCRGG
jgi:monoamine oxidase